MPCDSGMFPHASLGLSAKAGDKMHRLWALSAHSWRGQSPSNKVAMVGSFVFIVKVEASVFLRQFVRNCRDPRQDFFFFFFLNTYYRDNILAYAYEESITRR